MSMELLYTEKKRTAIKHFLIYLPQNLKVYHDLSARELLNYIGILKGLEEPDNTPQRVEQLPRLVR